MNTNNDGSDSPGQGQIRDALIFAQEIADREIASIERIHKRTLTSFGYIGTVVAAAIAIFGYIGYSNLRDAAIATARSQMENEVTEQVREKLTTEKINQIVQDQVKNLSAKTLTAEIQRELNSPPLSTSIHGVAIEEARRISKEQSSPRHLSPTQSKMLIQKLAQAKNLNGCPLGVTTAQFNVEATNYASDLKESISRTNVLLLDDINFEEPPIEGVGIYFDKRHPDTCARSLQDALRAAGVTAQLVPGTHLYSSLKGNRISGVDGISGLEIFVGSKPGL